MTPAWPDSTSEAEKVIDQVRTRAKRRTSRWWPLNAWLHTTTETGVGALAVVLYWSAMAVYYALIVMVPLGAIYLLVQFVKWAWMH